MTLSNWILLGFLIVLVIAFCVFLLVFQRKLQDYEGFCGINHGDEDPHRNDHIV